MEKNTLKIWTQTGISTQNFTPKLTKYISGWPILTQIFRKSASLKNPLGTVLVRMIDVLVMLDFIYIYVK